MKYFYLFLFEALAFYRDNWDSIPGIGKWLGSLSVGTRYLYIWLTFGLVMAFTGGPLYQSLKASAGGASNAAAQWLVVHVIVWNLLAAFDSGTFNRWHFVALSLALLSGLSVIKAGG